MKRFFVPAALVMIAILVLGLTGCVSQADFKALQSKNQQLESQVTKMQTEMAELKKQVLYSPSEELEKYKNSVVVLKFRLESAPGVSGEIPGLGVVIEENNQRYILSLWHILTGNGKITIDFAKKYLRVYLESGPGKGRALDWQADQRTDVVIIKMPQGLDYFPIPVDNSDNLKIGQTVYIISSPWQEGITIREGVVGSLNAPSGIISLFRQAGITNLGENDILIMSYAGISGDSGGAILTFIDGKLKMIGIHQGARGEKIGDRVAPVLAFGIKINPFLQQARELMKKL